MVEAGFFAGKTLAEHLVAQLNSRGLDVPPDMDDFAWAFCCNVNKHTLWVHVSKRGDGENEWLVTANSTLGFIGRLLGKTDEAEIKVLCQHLHQILAENERVSGIRWYTEEEWNRSANAGSPTPS